MKPPVIGVIAAIAITTAMDANGLSNFSALPLLLLTGVFWYWQRFPAKEMGLEWGSLRDHGLAVLYPLIVLGTYRLPAWGRGPRGGADWKNAGLSTWRS